LIGYDEDVKKAMEFVFGHAFIVNNENDAHKLCYEMKSRVVTLLGDVYDPDGKLSGGMFVCLLLLLLVYIVCVLLLYI
jgi:structural maintenance of chromosome 2